MMPRAMTIEQLGEALKRADNAGDVEGARKLAREIRRRRRTAAMQKHPNFVLPTSRGTAFASGALQGTPIVGPSIRNVAEDIASAVGSLLTGRSIGEVREEIAAQGAASREEFPGATVAGELVGGTATTTAALPARAVATLPRAVMTGAALGGGDRAARDLDRGETPNVEDAAFGAAAGAAGGAVGASIGRGLANLWLRFTGGGLQRSLPEVARRSVEAGKKAVDAAAKRMDESGLVISGSSFGRLVHRMERTLTREGLSAEGTPHAWQALKLLKSAQERGGNLTIRELNTLRQRVRDILPKSASGTERHLVEAMGRKFKDFIGSLPERPNAVVSGDVRAGVGAWKRMNMLNSRAKKQDFVANLLERAHARAAQGKTSLDKALQDQFGSFFTKRGGVKELKDRGFTDGEIQMMREAAEGSMTKALNSMDRAFGQNMLAPVWRVLRSPARFGARVQTEGRIRQLEGMPGVPALPEDASTLGALFGIMVPQAGERRPARRAVGG